MSIGGIACGMECMLAVLFCALMSAGRSLVAPANNVIIAKAHGFRFALLIKPYACSFNNIITLWCRQDTARAFLVACTGVAPGRCFFPRRNRAVTVCCTVRVERQTIYRYSGVAHHYLCYRFVEIYSKRCVLGVP